MRISLKEFDYLTNIVPCENAFEIDSVGNMNFSEYKCICKGEECIELIWLDELASRFEFPYRAIDKELLKTCIFHANHSSSQERCNDVFNDWFDTHYRQIGEAITRGIHIDSDILEKYNRGKDDYQMYVWNLYKGYNR